MEATTPFAQMPATPEGIIAQVSRQLRFDYPSGVDAQGNALDHIAAEAVQGLWQSRVRAFVPVLALREARELLRDRGMTPRPPPRETIAPPGPPAGQSTRDAMRLDHDVMMLDADDVLRY